jgi:flagellar hook-basal body complex protein FliE
MDIRSTLAAQTYAAIRPAAAPKAESGGTAEAFAGAARGFAATLAEGEATAKAAMTGSADSLALVQALAETQLAVETAVTVRDRVVEAYQEILRMPV